MAHVINQMAAPTARTPSSLIKGDAQAVPLIARPALQLNAQSAKKTIISNLVNVSIVVLVVLSAWMKKDARNAMKTTLCLTKGNAPIVGNRVIL